MSKKPFLQHPALPWLIVLGGSGALWIVSIIFDRYVAGSILAIAMLWAGVHVGQLIKRGLKRNDTKQALQTPAFDPVTSEASKKQQLLHLSLPLIMVIGVLIALFAIGKVSHLASSMLSALVFPIFAIGYIGYLVVKALQKKKFLSSRTTRAFLLAPVIPALVLALGVKNAMWFFVALQVSYISMLLLALPFYVWISKRYKVNIWHCLGAGILIGTWPGCFIGYSKELLMTTGFGVSTAFIFWLIGIKEWKKPKSPE